MELTKAQKRDKFREYFNRSSDDEDYLNDKEVDSRIASWQQQVYGAGGGNNDITYDLLEMGVLEGDAEEFRRERC